MNYVTHCRKDADGDIIGLGWPDHWYDTSTNIIRSIDSGAGTFVVAVNGTWVKVVVRQGVYRRYLATVADGYGANNLDNLPEM
ncbi:DUF3892 domain-containing protein [Aeromicrobium sp. CF4.19]|uniref:DUF3892 domain-containing protein n=1 Tax=Aeromicrobium sp. CF4.19 TaxID=3373082 RepID=UPI003EE6FA9F